MKLICTANYCNASSLVLPKDPTVVLNDTNYVSSTEWYTIDRVNSGYCLRIGSLYDVFSVMIYKKEIRYLIIDENGHAGFFPSKLFSICDRFVILDWELFDYSLCGEPLLLLGPSCIVGEYNQICAIVEERAEMVRSVLEYRDSLDKWS